MERASYTLERLMAKAIERMPAEELPQAAWDFAAGHAVAEKTRVVGCEDKRLVVEVPDATWRTQLAAMAQQFLSRIHKFTRGAASIEYIEFRLASPKSTGTQGIA
jgi:predicted nucleic acid-binding Zn ribbon protein